MHIHIRHCWIFLCCFMLFSCKKEAEKKENYVAYKLNGDFREQSGGYSSTPIRGVQLTTDVGVYGFASYQGDLDESLVCRMIPSNAAYGQSYPLDSVLSLHRDRNTYLLINIKGSDGIHRDFVSRKGSEGYCKIEVNNPDVISGHFSAILYNAGEPYFYDSIFITDGYFYLNK